MSFPTQNPVLAFVAGAALAANLSAAVWSVQSTTASEPLTASVDGEGTLCVAGAGRRDCWPLPPATIVQSIEPDGEGWVASGRTLVDGNVHLYLLAGGPAGTRLLPPLPRHPADQRGSPVPLIDDGRLVGVAWLQHGAAQAHSVWAAVWNGTAWEEPRLVSPGGELPQVALVGAVLPDGRWLLAWTRHDGEDDETVFSVGAGGRWSAPRRVLADNTVFDILPAVTATPAGALAAWSRFDGADYRAVVALFDGSSWSEVDELPGRGVDVSSFTRLGGGTQLLYSSVVPESWHLVQLDPSGRVLARREVAAGLDERPLVGRGGAGELDLAWPGRDRPPPREVGTAPPAAVEGGTFRYMAFGDSITQGIGCGNGSQVYPARLASSSYLNCGANGCQVVNKGKGGEQTNQGVTRIQAVLDTEGPWDVVLLMEGTNDICWSSRTNQQAQSSLGQMESEATQRGVDTLHVTIVDLNRRGEAASGEFPCPEDMGREDNADSNGMETRVRDNLANVDPDTGYRWWANTRSNTASPPEVAGAQPLCDDNVTTVPGPANSCLDTYFGNDWGHPNCNGYARLADEVRDGIVAKPKPNGVALVSPIGTVFTAVPIFQWNKESPRDATWYHVEITGPGGTLFDQWRSETTCSATAGSCSLAITPLADGSYTWRVRGRNPHGRSSWAVAAFTVLTPPSAPDPVAPAGSIGDPRPTFTWNKEVPIKSTSYRVQVRDAQAIILSDTTWEADAVCSGASCSAEPLATGLLLVDGNHTWRVRGINAAGEGAWSPALAFEVTGTSGIFADGFESGDASRWTTTVP